MKKTEEGYNEVVKLLDDNNNPVEDTPVDKKLSKKVAVLEEIHADAIRRRKELFQEEREEEKLKKEAQAKRKALQKWKERPVGFAQPFVRCSKCACELSIQSQPFIARQMLGTRRTGLASLAGAVSCEKCGQQTYFLQWEVNKENLMFINDKATLEGKRLGIGFGQGIPKEGINQHCLKCFKELKPIRACTAQKSLRFK